MAREQRFDPRFTNILYVAVFCIALISIFFYMNAESKRQTEQTREYEQQQRIIRQAKEEEERLAELARQELAAKSSFYQKLAEGIDVNILIVGDSIGYGTGASSQKTKYPEMLCETLESTYGVKTRLTNVSMGGNSSFSGYARTMRLDDGIDYDLVILCYGQNDSSTNLGLYYEAMIRSVKKRYPKASIISILQSSQREYTPKMEMIQSLADHYGIPVADTIAPFQENYEALVAEDLVHPNDAGYRIYLEQLLGVIEPLVAEYHGYDQANMEPVNTQVSIFETFQWHPKREFKREGNTFILQGAMKGTILSIDYIFSPGKNSCKILVDGTEYAAPERSFDYDFSQHHIMIVNDWMAGESIDVQQEIRIVFGEDENGTIQANGFQGIAIIGQ